MFARFSKPIRAGCVSSASRRMFSKEGTHAHAKVEMEQWFRLTIGMVGLSTTVALYNIVFHSHEHATTGLPYQRIRNKPYPWSCSDCTLLDYACWDECKGKGKPAEHH